MTKGRVNSCNYTGPTLVGEMTLSWRDDEPSRFFEGKVKNAGDRGHRLYAKADPRTDSLMESPE
jgi:hypothetical protein